MAEFPRINPSRPTGFLVSLDRIPQSIRLVAQDLQTCGTEKYQQVQRLENGCAKPCLVCESKKLGFNG